MIKGINSSDVLKHVAFLIYSKETNKRRVNVNALDSTLETPLIVASRDNNLPLSRYLIEKGTDVNVQELSNYFLRL